MGSSKALIPGSIKTSFHINTFKKRVEKHFDKAAHTYDSAAELQNRVAAKVMMLLPSTKCILSVLDLGAGTGLHTKLLAQRYPKAMVVGTDLSESMVKYASSASDYDNNNHWSVGDIENLPFCCGSFDIVYSNLAIQWCDLDIAIKEVRRVLKPGGFFVFSTLAAGTMAELSLAWQLVDNASHTNTFMPFLEQKNHFEAGFPNIHTLRCQTEKLSYPNVKTLLKDLKALGVNAVLSPNKGLTTRNRLEALEFAYEGFRRNDGLPLSYQVVYGCLENYG